MASQAPQDVRTMDEAFHELLAADTNAVMRNLPFVYEGLKATARENVRLGDYNELKLRHFHQLYGERVDGVETPPR